jgi:hypothetical protein
VTSLPQPNIAAKCIRAQQNPLNLTFAEALHAVASFPPKGCGDLVYSGHMACALVACIILTREGCAFGPRAVRVASLALICAAPLVSMLSIFGCRSHYTVDVVLAFYFAFGLTEFYYLRVDSAPLIRWIEAGERGLLEEAAEDGDEQESAGLLQLKNRSYGAV